MPRGKKVWTTERTPNVPGLDNWMNPLNRIVWFKAFKAKQQEVQISDGRQFRVDYSRQPGKIWIEPIGSSLVPCGWFDAKRVSDKTWLEGTDK
jgi:hypothetical protein